MAASRAELRDLLHTANAARLRAEEADWARRRDEAERRAWARRGSLGPAEITERNARLADILRGNRP